MLDSIQKSSNFDLLPPQEKKQLLAVYLKGGLSDFEVDQLLMNLAAHGQWEGLRLVLKFMSIRRRLSVILPQLQEMASSRLESQNLVKSLPQRLDAETALIALDFTLHTRIWGLAKDLVDRGAYLSTNRFRAVVERYEAEKDAFDRSLIIYLMGKGSVDWKKSLGFHDSDGWREVLTKAINTKSASLYLCASCLMSSQQKQEVIRKSDSKERFLMAIENMNLTGNWQKAIPDAYRDDAFAYHLGI